MSRMFDACILGAGPAGLSAALWLHNLGLRPAIFDSTQHPGGAQRLNFLTNDWVLGTGGLTGPQLSDRFVSHVQSLAVPMEMSAEPISLMRRPNGFGIGFRLPGATREVTVRTLVIATGTHYRGSEVLAGVEGFDKVLGSSLAFGPYAFADLERCRGQRILIVGGGDNAFENARRLIGVAAAITVVVRSRPRAQAQLISALRNCRVPGIAHILEGATIEGVGVVPMGLRVIVGSSGRKWTVECDRIHVLAGYEPNTTFLAALTDGAGLPPVTLDAEGYIVVDERMGTSCPGIYAAGDVCNRRFPSVVSAIGQGAVAAKAIEADLAP
jgi:thioredoxin reductase (NADPH)